MKTIKLYGILAQKFGKEFRLAVDSTKEAMRALCVQVQGFEQFMMNAHLQGLRFAVYHDDVNIGESELDMTHSSQEIKVVPVVEGSGGDNGLMQTILGAVLVVVGIVGNIYGGWGTPFITAGIGLMVGGIAQMMMPKVETEDQNQDGNKANKGFGGAVTTVAQGNPVPILYGEREVGGFIVSASQRPEDQL